MRTAAEHPQTGFTTATEYDIYRVTYEDVPWREPCGTLPESATDYSIHSQPCFVNNSAADSLQPAEHPWIHPEPSHIYSHATPRSIPLPLEELWLLYKDDPIGLNVVFTDPLLEELENIIDSAGSSYQPPELDVSVTSQDPAELTEVGSWPDATPQNKAASDALVTLHSQLRPQLPSSPPPPAAAVAAAAVEQHPLSPSTCSPPLRHNIQTSHHDPPNKAPSAPPSARLKWRLETPGKSW